MLYEYQRFTFLQRLLVKNALHNSSNLDEMDFREYQVTKSKCKIADIDSPSMIKRKIWIEFGNIIQLIESSYTCIQYPIIHVYNEYRLLLN